VVTDSFVIPPPVGEEKKKPPGFFFTRKERQDPVSIPAPGYVSIEMMIKIPFGCFREAGLLLPVV
jgi:hypothetical protein